MTGGVSDPRNSVLLKLFSFLDLGERAGSGVPKIVDALKETFGTKPVYSEKYSPDRTEMIFYFDKKSEKFDENREILEKITVININIRAKSSVKQKEVR